MTCKENEMASVKRKVIYMTTVALFFCAFPPTNSISLKTFNFKWVNGSHLNFSFPRTKHGDCVYDSSRDLATCMKNHPYDVITSTWRYSPENITYISVNCLQQRIYSSNQRQCICKNRSMAAHPHKQRQTDSYVFCQLDAIYRDMLSPLVNLEVLDLSHNNLFRVPPDCFRDMKKIKFLSLSNNPIISFFDGVLCDLPNLEVLILQDLPMKRFPQNLFACGQDFQSNVKVIDIGHSKIESISPGDFNHLSNLGFLDLSYNELTDLPEEPFIGLTSLETIDLSGNHFSNIPDTLCSNLTSLKRMFMTDNELISFNCSIFELCSDLETIDLSHGTISIIEGSPCRVNSLVVLDLSENQLLHIPAKLLKKESTIKTLDLSQNMLEGVDFEAFHDMIHLVFLNLSLNQISQIDAIFRESFKHLINLRTLDLKGNVIESINDGSFEHLQAMTELNLSGNSLRNISRHTFIGGGKIEKLYLSKNNVSLINRNVFAQMNSLVELDLSNNDIDNMDIFFPSTLKHLDISSNTICKLRMINALPNLERLDLKGNNLTTLKATYFKDMTSLRILDVSENRLSSIDDETFMYLSQLQILVLSDNYLKLNLSNNMFRGSSRMLKLDLSHNGITDIDSIFNGGSFNSLEHLDLSFNNITSLDTPLNNQNDTVALKSLNLQSCGIRSVRSNVFKNLKFLENVNLQNNLFTFVPLFEARLGTMFYFKNNPLVCSCDMVWILKRWLDTDTAEKMSTYDYDVDVCEVYPSMTLQQIRKLSAVDFMCPVNATCPNACQCYVLKNGGSIYMTVCRGNLTEVPKELPSDSEFMYFDGNNFGSLNVISSGYHYTERLFLNSSGIISIAGNVFSDFSHVSHIDISFNKLTSLPSSLFHGLDNLRDINLKYNSLQQLDKGLFDNVPSLQNIDVSFNKLHHVTPETLAELDNLDKFRWIRLAGNPLVCACPNYEFRQWMEKSYNRVYDRRNTLCEGEEIRRVDEERFSCDNSLPASLKTTIVVISIVAAMLPVIIMLVYCRREVIAVCYARVVPLFAKTQQHHQHHHAHPYLYDAVVLYDTSDPKCSWWVQKSLRPKLTEGRRKYILYIPEPSWESNDTTVFNIKKSRCTIALVTNTFQHNRFAYDCFRHSVTQEVNNDSDHHVVVVTWGLIDKRNLPSCLRHYFDHTKVLPVTTTCFWDKLMQKLPDTLNREITHDESQGETNPAFIYDENRV